MIDLVNGFLEGVNFIPELELAIILAIASVLGIFFRFVKQPLVLAYLVTGILVGYFGFLNMEDGGIFKVFSTLGVMFLLFLVGMEMDFDSIKKTGKVSVVIGLGQVIFTGIGGFLLGYYLFGFDFITAIYIAVALTFSSTVIIIKLLSDKGSLTSLHGRAAIGLLLVQDLIVILILIGLNAIEMGGAISLLSLAKTVGIGIGLFAVMLFLGKEIFPYIFKKIARSEELLFLVSITWLLVFAMVVKQIGFSIEIAGFLGGVALANSSERYHISNKIRPLRDFFILIFFVYLGSLMVLSSFEGLIFPAVIFSLFVLIGNPIIVMILMGIMRFKKRTSFLTGVTVAQISEFSLIFATLGLSLGHITDQVFAIIVIVGVITITLSTYLILYSEKIFSYISGPLSIFERKDTNKIKEDDSISKPIVLIGANRIGRGIMNHIDEKNVTVIDFDPIVIDDLRSKGVYCVFTDIKDPHFLEEMNVENTKIFISTSPQIEDNITLVRSVKKMNKDIKVVTRAENDCEALILYKEGVDYVLLPHLLSGKYLGKMIDSESGIKKLKELKEKEIKIIEKQQEKWLRR